ncbi:MAG: putative Fe-S protein [Marinobacter excellens HL-55]|uniref:Putative Fe-S protein n=1 Tax=Marinobacter excellens HL-55 TaxID=1305731 RepID=A0A0P7YBH5_9GAMM|nr:MAG: putative Fe-S protein [Marinobacter excellens HL-55]
MKVSDKVRSPCVSVCALDENDICIGCQRSGDEIFRWTTMTNDERREVLLKVAEREKKVAI